MREPNPGKSPTGDTTRAHQVVVEALEDHGEFNEDSREWTLYDHIDPDALDNLFNHEGNSNPSVTFEAEGVTVTVWKDGEVHATVE
jgi:hypothetical protein